MNAETPRKFLGLLSEGARSALQWRLLLCWVAFTAASSLLALAPIWLGLASQLDHFPLAADWSAPARLLMISDLLGQLRPAALPIAGAGGSAVVLMLILAPLLNAFFLVSARRGAALAGTGGGANLGELFRGGLVQYGRMLRLMLVSALPLGVAIGAGALLQEGATRFGEHAMLASTAEHWRWAAVALAGLLFAFADASVDAARAQWVLQPSRRSALLAWGRGLRLVLREPLRSLGLYLLITLGAGILAALLAGLRLQLPDLSPAGFLAGLLLAQVAVAIVAWMHYARQFAMLALVRRSQAGR